MPQTLEQVREFWETNPLWTGEANYEPGSKEFFEEQLRVVVEDGYVGQLDEREFPESINNKIVLDLGCGPGLRVIELARRGCKNIFAADLTKNALTLSQKRCQIYGVKAKLSQQNAESLAFNDKTFSFVTCQGVIHHTPNTEACLREIARVLNDQGTASISVYYRNIFLRMWSYLAWPRKFLARLGAGLLGRGREHIYAIDDIDEVVRYFDGKDNPIGKSYTRQQFIQLLEPHFEIQETYLHFFPARTLPFKLPKFIHKRLDHNAGFMIHAKVKKKSNGSQT